MPVELSEFKVGSPCCKLVMAMVICGGPKLNRFFFNGIETAEPGCGGRLRVACSVS